MSEDNNELKAPQEQQPVEYTDDNIRHLSDMEHVRTRPGMYIGRLGDGNLPEDGIYVLLKEVVDNSIDEFKMGAAPQLYLSEHRTHHHAQWSPHPQPSWFEGSPDR